MTTLYTSQRRGDIPKRPKTTLRHHAGWGIICVILMVVVTGLWTQVQSLNTTNRSLKQQLIAAQKPATTCRANTTWKASATIQQSIPTRDGERHYNLHIPADFQTDRYYPLIIMYGGRGASPTDIEPAFGMNNLPAIVAYPYPTISKEGDLAWEGAPYSSTADDIGFTNSILDKIQLELCVDETRIYAVGFSNGGGFMSKLSCELSERFAAYAVIAGAMYQPASDCVPPRAAPLMTIHGDNDQIVPFDGSAIRHLPSIYDWTAKRASIESCTGQPTIRNIDESRVLTTWDKCRDNETVQHIRIHGGPHAWGNVSNDIIWQFLHQHTLR